MPAMPLQQELRFLSLYVPCLQDPRLGPLGAVPWAGPVSGTTECSGGLAVLLPCHAVPFQRAPGISGCPFKKQLI